MSEQFTDRVQRVMGLAREEAARFNQEYVCTEHMLLAMIKEGSANGPRGHGTGSRVLKNRGITLQDVRGGIERLVRSGPETTMSSSRMPLSPPAQKVVDYMREEARNLDHRYIGTEHLLLGLLRDPETIAAKVLVGLGLNLKEIREEILNLLGVPPSVT